VGCGRGNAPGSAASVGYCGAMSVMRRHLSIAPRRANERCVTRRQAQCSLFSRLSSLFPPENNGSIGHGLFSPESCPEKLKSCCSFRWKRLHIRAFHILSHIQFTCITLVVTILYELEVTNVNKGMYEALKLLSGSYVNSFRSTHPFLPRALPDLHDWLPEGLHAELLNHTPHTGTQRPAPGWQL
jgi:hypothetical protein